MATDSKLKFDSKSNPGMVKVMYDGQSVGYIAKLKVDPKSKKKPTPTHGFLPTGTLLKDHISGPDYVTVREAVRKQLS